MTPVDREVIKEYLGDNTTEVKGSITTAKQEILAKVKETADAGSSAGGVQTFTEDGTFTVPAGVTKILITAFAGGAGGKGMNGGQGGSHIHKRAFAVTPKTIFPITVGKGGAAENNGGATVIGDLVTLVGGFAPGTRIPANHNGAASGYDAVYAYHGYSGSNKTGINGNVDYYGGNGGGAGFERGGRGGDALGKSGENGGIGAGGGGKGGGSGSGTPGAGGNGIVIIEW